MTGKLLKIDGIWRIKYFDDMKGHLQVPLCYDDRVMLNSHLSAALSSENSFVDFEFIEIEGLNFAKLITNQSPLIEFKAPKNSITFQLDSESPKEVMRIEKGKFYFKGEEIEDIHNVYDKVNWFFDKSKENYQDKTITDEEIDISAFKLLDKIESLTSIQAFKLGSKWSIEQLKSK